MLVFGVRDVNVSPVQVDERVVGQFQDLRPPKAMRVPKSFVFDGAPPCGP